MQRPRHNRPSKRSGRHHRSPPLTGELVRGWCGRKRDWGVGNKWIGGGDPAPRTRPEEGCSTHGGCGPTKIQVVSAASTETTAFAAITKRQDFYTGFKMEDFADQNDSENKVQNNSQAKFKDQESAASYVHSTKFSNIQYKG
ncbi:hypothetical protein ZWY2020_012562 [Hordeum vulgare]|nr:hypothetical protein ZWY2020_012562 [Hordeum vulgare]